jgi:hypothetical protein
MLYLRSKLSQVCDLSINIYILDPKDFKNVVAMETRLTGFNKMAAILDFLSQKLTQLDVHSYSYHKNRGIILICIFWQDKAIFVALIINNHPWILLVAAILNFETECHNAVAHL